MGKYSIWVLDYAAVNKFPQSVMLYGPQYAGVRNLPYAYVLIKGQGQVILVDTGYDHKEYGKYLADLYGVSNWHSAVGSSRRMRRHARRCDDGSHHPCAFRSHGRARPLSQRQVLYPEAGDR